MALSDSTIITAVRELIYGAEPRHRPYQTALTNSPGTGGTTFSVGDGDAWQVGDQVETPDGELCLVTSILSNNLTVTRTQGRQAAENLASGEVVKKNPRFTYDQIESAMDDLLGELRAEGIYYLTTETIAYTTGDWYDVTDTEMEKVHAVWYIENGDFRTPYFFFLEDPANTQPKLFISSAGFTGNVFVNYQRPYALTTELPDRLRSLMANGIAYKLLGTAAGQSTMDPGKRTDRTVQGGQEARDSYWFFREYERLARNEEALLREQVKRLPTHRVAARSRRFIR